MTWSFEGRRGGGGGAEDQDWETLLKTVESILHCLVVFVCVLQHLWKLLTL